MALCVICAVAMAGVLLAAVTGFAPVDLVSGPVMLAFGVVAFAYGIRAARHPGLGGPARRAYRVLAAALALSLATPLVFLITGPRPFPAPGDAAHLGLAALLTATFLLIPLREATPRDRWKSLLDAGTVVLGASMVLWYFVIGPAEQSAHLVVAAAAYPVVDLLALFGLARVLLRGSAQIGRRGLGLIGAAVFMLFVGDAYLGYTQAHTAAVQRTPWQFACWLTMHFLLACGALELWRTAAAPAAPTGPHQRDVAGKLPYLGIGVGYALMAVAALAEHDGFPWAGLVAGGMGITGLVVLRQVLARTESTEAAETDALTGLANRARLRLELSRILHRAARTGRPVAALLVDLNGFKQVNDTLGHRAGDELLAAVAGAMRRAVRPDVLIGRLGGDEFVLVLQAGRERATAVAQRVAEAVTGPFVVGAAPMNASASVGVAVSEPGELSADALLHRADVAMYDRKRSGRPTAPVTAPRPIRSLAGGRVVGVEAPAVGLAEALTSRKVPQYVVVPVGRAQLDRPGFAEEVAEALAATGTDARDLVLDVPDVTPVLPALRELGVRLAVHDVATAYAARDHTPVDFLRLPWLDGRRDPAVTEAAVRLGQSLDLAVLVDGVEVPAGTTDLAQLLL